MPFDRRTFLAATLACVGRAIVRGANPGRIDVHHHFAPPAPRRCPLI